MRINKCSQCGHENYANTAIQHSEYIKISYVRQSLTTPMAWYSGL